MQTNAHRSPVDVDGVPPEIWSRIFSFLQATAKLNDWIQITYVCRHWSEISLGSPLLWSNISTSNPHSDAWIKRSGKVPLCAELRIDSVESLSASCVVLQELPRIKELQIAVVPLLWDKIRPYLGVEAPALESFTLQRIEMYTRPIPYVSLPDDVFVRTTPSLQRLSIQDSRVDIRSPIFTGLTQLKIQGLKCNWFSPDNLLLALQRMPLLESFYFGYEFFGRELAAALFSSPDPGMIPLPNLIDIDLNGNFFDWDLYILSHINFSSKATFSFCSDVISHHATSFPRILRAYEQARNHTPIPMDTALENELVFTLEVQECLYLRLHQSDGSREERLSILLGGGWDISELRPWARELLSLPLSKITIFETDVLISSSVWQRLLPAFEQLKTLNLTDLGATAFLYHLNRVYNVGPQFHEGDEEAETEGQPNEGLDIEQEDRNDTSLPFDALAIPLNLTTINICTTDGVLPLSGLEIALKAQMLHGQQLGRLSIESLWCQYDEQTALRLTPLVHSFVVR
ncbi:hypothetical protein BDN72DRAFT_843399 [Pluteus cervinus]|uniref:Uncharacterized protein n=1 Tax=Pluteus cervinus TaxID=181527 RepID=A0ACD3AQM9_9AGAR|nr:hypothetical protein BDN72DRAFT_843399 [Pluteus cervinus]